MYDLQKAAMSKRISAFLLDIILLVTLVVGLAWAIFAISGYDGYAEKFEKIETQYIEKYEELYDGIDLTITAEDYEKLSDETKKTYDEAYGEYLKAFQNDEEANYHYAMMMNIVLIAASLSFLLGYLILEFAVPLFLRNGQTIGKKVFAIGLMHTNGVKLSSVGLFVRTVLGKYTLETMIPVFAVLMLLNGATVGLIAGLLSVMIALFEIGLFIVNKTRPMIHDALASTVCVDMASQMIFNSTEELIEYKKRIHKEDVDKAEYAK